MHMHCFRTKHCVVPLLCVLLLLAACTRAPKKETASQLPQVNNQELTKPQNEETTPDLPASNDRVQESNMVSIKDIQPGDQIAGLLVTSAEYFDDYNFIINFSGQLTLSGFYNYFYDDYSGGPNVTFQPDEELLRKMPQILEDEMEQGYLTLYPNAEFEPLGSKGTATIVIDRYRIDRREMGTTDSARLVQLVKKKMIARTSFSIHDIAPGEEIAGMKVISVDSNTVVFEGEVTVSGYFYSYKDNGKPIYWFQPETLPFAYDHPIGSHDFIFSNQDLAEKLLSSLGNGRVTVKVSGCRIQKDGEPNTVHLLKLIEDQ